MTEQMIEELKKLVLTNFSEDCQITEQNVLDFMLSNESVYKQIHNDMNCSLIRCNKLIQNSDVPINTFRVLYEKFMMDSYCNLPPAIQELYFQGLFDVFELVFIVFVDFEKIHECMEWFTVFEHDFKPFLGEIRQFFTYDYDKLVKICLQIYNYIYKQTKFNMDTINKQLKLTRNYMKKYDKQFYNAIEDIPKLQIQGILMKNQIACCLHVTNSFEISCKLASLYLTSGIDKQCFIVQQLLSALSRKCTSIFIKSKYDDLYQIEIDSQQLELSGNTELDMMIILNQTLPTCLTSKNAYNIVQYLDSLSELYKKYKLKENLNIAKELGIQVAFLAMGIPGLGLAVAVAQIAVQKMKGEY
ncbi:Conserved_hypothetical protein [Hexamita inflata]|uniref:Uncharacterized protein n=1 Tax=Hexamita inflata TaxID=28002 RepID=A0AA86PJS8_9EUKA|nr:Conserved hypothetical protein [Hexamita inflata]